MGQPEDYLAREKDLYAIAAIADGDLDLLVRSLAQAIKERCPDRLSAQALTEEIAAWMRDTLIGPGANERWGTQARQRQQALEELAVILARRPTPLTDPIG